MLARSAAAALTLVVLSACEGTLSSEAGIADAASGADSGQPASGETDGRAGVGPAHRDARTDVLGPSVDLGPDAPDQDVTAGDSGLGPFPGTDALGPGPARPDAAQGFPPMGGAEPPPPMGGAEPPPPVDPPCAPRAWARPDNCPQETEVVIWSAGGWNTLAAAFAADLSPCAAYYISVPPLADEKTTLRAGEAAGIRALGPQFHALAEFHDVGWADWRDANGATWPQAAAEFRRRAAEAGFCLGDGDGWVMNEVHSDARSNPASRARYVDLFRALHEGAAGAADDAPGMVTIIGMGQVTVNLGVYKANLQEWLADRDFWEGISAHVRWWAQETYVDATLVGVGDATLGDRAAHINKYTMHVGRQAVVAPDEAGANAAQSYFNRAYVPLMNAVWGAEPGTGYGDTTITLDNMLAFVTEQVYARRAYSEANAHPDGRIGFALKSYNDPTEYAAIGERLARAIAAESAPGGVADDACRGPAGARQFCQLDVDAAAFNDAWDTFQTW